MILNKYILFCINIFNIWCLPMVYLLIPRERRVVGFEFTLCNIPSALEGVLSTISGYNLNIYYIETCFRTDDEYGLFMAVDFTGADISPEKLLEEIKKKEYVKDVIISPRFKNIIYPSRFCTMDLGGIRAIIIAVANMRGIIEGIKKELGEEIGNTFLFRMGYEIGRMAYMIYAEGLGITKIDEGIEILKALGRGSRWLEILEYMVREDKIIIKTMKSWECEIQKEKADKPVSQYIRGVFAGFFKELLSKKVSVRETKCMAMGDPYCQFEITIL